MLEESPYPALALDGRKEPTEAAATAAVWPTNPRLSVLFLVTCSADGLETKLRLRIEKPAAVGRKLANEAAISNDFLTREETMVVVLI